MTEEQPTADLVTMTAEIVAAYVANNALGTGDVGGLIGTVYASLATLGQAPEEEAPAAKPTGAVSARKSLANSAHILSMIDGKPYKMLTRHIGRNGYTPESYREAFGLPRDYPMVAPDYAGKRRELALKIGLGRKREPAPAAEPAKVPARRGRKPKSLGDAIGAAKGHLGGE